MILPNLESVGGSLVFSKCKIKMSFEVGTEPLEYEMTETSYRFVL